MMLYWLHYPANRYKIALLRLKWKPEALVHGCMQLWKAILLPETSLAISNVISIAHANINNIDREKDIALLSCKWIIGVL